MLPGVGIVLERFAGTDKFLLLPVWVVLRYGFLGRVLAPMGVRIILRQLLRRRQSRET